MDGLRNGNSLTAHSSGRACQLLDCIGGHSAPLNSALGPPCCFPIPRLVFLSFLFSFFLPFSSISSLLFPLFSSTWPWFLSISCPLFLRFPSFSLALSLHCLSLILILLLSSRLFPSTLCFDIDRLILAFPLFSSLQCITPSCSYFDSALRENQFIQGSERLRR